MANDSEKKRAKRNAEALLYLRFVTLAIHVLYVLLRWVLFGSTFGKLLGFLHGAVMLVDAVVVYTLGNWARDGVDLSDPGVGPICLSCRGARALCVCVCIVCVATDCAHVPVTARGVPQGLIWHVSAVSCLPDWTPCLVTGFGALELDHHGRGDAD